jgi:hypothetical protein
MMDPEPEMIGGSTAWIDAGPGENGERTGPEMIRGEDAGPWENGDMMDPDTEMIE